MTLNNDNYTLSKLKSIDSSNIILFCKGCCRKMNEIRTPDKTYHLKDIISNQRFTTTTINNDFVFIKSFTKCKESKLQNEMILSEVYSLLMLLDSKYVVDLIEVIEDDYSIFLITEYIEKGDLFNYIFNNGPLDEKSSISIFNEMVYALYDVHSRGIVHRDIKLENFLLTDNFKVKLCDFGHSGFTRMDSLILTSDSIVKGDKIFFKRKCGTLPYSSPAIIKEKLYDGEQEDIWSLGICLYALLTCHYPFYDNNNDERTKELILKSPIPKIPHKVSEETLKLIKSMLQRNCQKRANLNEIIQRLSNMF